MVVAGEKLERREVKTIVDDNSLEKRHRRRHSNHGNSVRVVKFTFDVHGAASDDDDYVENYTDEHPLNGERPRLSGWRLPELQLRLQCRRAVTRQTVSCYRRHVTMRSIPWLILSVDSVKPRQ